MSLVLRTERKYNIRHNHYAIPAYILMFGLVIMAARTIWAVIINMPRINSDSIFWIIIFFVYLLFFYIIIYILGIGVKKNDDSYGIGYCVEELVGTKLAALGDGYQVIHDISKGRKHGNIDHLVIGPTGIFVVESKANRNKMIYYQNNIRKLSELAEKFMKQAAGNALWVNKIIEEHLGIKKWVYGIVVRPLNEDKKIETYCSNRVCIMDGNSVYDHIRNFSDGLYSDEINKIHALFCKIKRGKDKK